MSDIEFEKKMLLTVQEAARSAEAQSNPQRCYVSGEAVFFIAYTHALMPGHIYSDAGAKEISISGCCEYHFDKMFANDDEPQAPAFCSGLCLSGYDVGVESSSIAYAHPGCPVHGDFAARRVN